MQFFVKGGKTKGVEGKSARLGGPQSSEDCKLWVRKRRRAAACYTSLLLRNDSQQKTLQYCPCLGISEHLFNILHSSGKAADVNRKIKKKTKIRITIKKDSDHKTEIKTKTYYY
jgi:hypothetical protein